jgi:hypothetical protein
MPMNRRALLSVILCTALIAAVIGFMLSPIWFLVAGP